MYRTAPDSQRTLFRSQDAAVTQHSSISSNIDRKVSQTMPPWGLDRIDSRTGLDQVYNSAFTGDGVTIAIVDSGVLSTHREFTERIVGCFDFTGDGCDSSGSHGTHVGKSNTVIKCMKFHPWMTNRSLSSCKYDSGHCSRLDLWSSQGSKDYGRQGV
jgi:hypothetical protein